MKIVRLILGIIVGLIMISLVAETIEFFTVKIASGLPFSELSDPKNQSTYFATRNTAYILGFKMIYSLLAGFVGGYVAAWISTPLNKRAIYLLIGIQISTLAWAGFFSTEFSATGPLWMWMALILIVPLGIWLGHQQKMKV